MEGPAKHCHSLGVVRIAVEHVERGDAMRGLMSSGVGILSTDVHVLLEHSNRGKKSLGLDLTSEEIVALIDRATELKARLRDGVIDEPLKNRTLALVFEKSSTRTRVSFEAAMVQFGGATLFLSPRDTQLGRGEPIEDTARVLSRMVDVVAIRTFEHEKIERFAKAIGVLVLIASGAGFLNDGDLVKVVAAPSTTPASASSTPASKS